MEGHPYLCPFKRIASELLREHYVWRLKPLYSLMILMSYITTWIHFQTWLTICYLLQGWASQAVLKIRNIWSFFSTLVRSRCRETWRPWRPATSSTNWLRGTKVWYMHFVLNLLRYPKCTSYATWLKHDDTFKLELYMNACTVCSKSQKVVFVFSYHNVCLVTISYWANSILIIQ